MKKVFFIVLLGSLLFPLISFGASYNTYEDNGKTVIYEGLVPCGKKVCVSTITEPEAVKDLLRAFENFEVDHPDFTFEKNCTGLGGEFEDAPCKICHLFIMTNGILTQIFIWVPIIGALFLIIGGVMFFYAGAKPSTVDQAKGIITSVVIGLLIIFSAWIVVNTIFTRSEIIKTDGWKWWQIECRSSKGAGITSTPQPTPAPAPTPAPQPTPTPAPTPAQTPHWTPELEPTTPPPEPSQTEFLVKPYLVYPADKPMYPEYETAVNNYMVELQGWYLEKVGETFTMAPLEVKRSSYNYLTMRCGESPSQACIDNPSKLEGQWEGFMNKAIHGGVEQWEKETIALIFSAGGGGYAGSTLYGENFYPAGWAITGDWTLEPISGIANTWGIPCSYSKGGECTGSWPKGVPAHELGHAFGIIDHPGEQYIGQTIMEQAGDYPTVGFLPSEIEYLLQSVFFSEP